MTPGLNETARPGLPRFAAALVAIAALLVGAVVPAAAVESPMPMAARSSAAAPAIEVLAASTSLAQAAATARAAYVKAHRIWVAKHATWVKAREARHAAEAAYAAHPTEARHAAAVKAKKAALKARAASKKARAAELVAKAAARAAKLAAEQVAVKDVSGSGTATATPVPVLTAPGIRATPAYDTAFLNLINAARADAGLPALTAHIGLTALASYWTGKLTTGGTDFQLVHNPDLAAMVAGVHPQARAWGENVAYFYAAYHSAAQVFSSYMNSPGHRANILSPAYHSVGVVSACVAAGAKDHAGVCFNTMDFGS